MAAFLVNSEIYPRADSIKEYVSENTIYSNSRLPRLLDLSDLEDMSAEQAFAFIRTAEYRDLHPITLLMAYHLLNSMVLIESYNEVHGYQELLVAQQEFAAADEAMRLLDGGHGELIPDESVPSTLASTLSILKELSKDPRQPEEVVFTSEYSLSRRLKVDPVVIHLLRRHRLGAGPYSSETLSAADLYLRLGEKLHSLVAVVFE